MSGGGERDGLIRFVCMFVNAAASVRRLVRNGELLLKWNGMNKRDGLGLFVCLFVNATSARTKGVDDDAPAGVGGEQHLRGRRRRRKGGMMDLERRKERNTLVFRSRPFAHAHSLTHIRDDGLRDGVEDDLEKAEPEELRRRDLAQEAPEGDEDGGHAEVALKQRGHVERGAHDLALENRVPEVVVDDAPLDACVCVCVWSRLRGWRWG